MKIPCHLKKNHFVFISTNIYSTINRKINTKSVYHEIQTACNHDHLNKALQILYSKTFNIETNKNHEMYSYLLQTCINTLTNKACKLVHAHMILTGFEPTSDHKTKLVILYSRLGKKESHKMFGEIPVKDVIWWTGKISTYSQHGHFHEAIELYNIMKDAGTMPNTLTYASILPAFANTGRLKEGKIIHEEIMEKKLNSNVYISNALIDMYGKCGCLDDARKLFDAMPVKSIVTWNTMMAGYANEGIVSEARKLFQLMPKRDLTSWAVMVAGYADDWNFNEALELFRRMLRDGIMPNSNSYTSVLPACRDSGDIGLGRQVHCVVVRNGEHSNVFAANALLDVYAQCGFIEDAQKIFRGITEYSVVSWTSMISGYVQNGDISEAARLFNSMPTQNVISGTAMIKGYINNGDYEKSLELFAQMVRRGIVPDEGAYSSVLSACTNSVALTAGKEVHNDIVRHGVWFHNSVWNSLTDMYCKCGSLDDACKVFYKMPFRDIVSWTIMIMGYAFHGHGKKAIDLFRRMQDSGTKPDEATFLGALTACAHSGLVNEAKSLFVSMSRDNGISPQLDHYTCMVDVLGRAGLFVEAENFILTMSMMPNEAVWGSLLNSCKIHNNVELGSRVADKIFQLNPQKKRKLSTLV